MTKAKKTAKAKGGKAKGGKAKAEPVKPSEVMKMPPEALVRSVARDIRSTATDKGELSKELRDIIAAAKSDKGLHPAALRLVEGWVHKAKNTDRGLAAVATLLAHLDYYRDVLGLDELLKKQGQMFARAEAGEKEPDEKKQLTFGGKIEGEPEKTAEDAPPAAVH